MNSLTSQNVVERMATDLAQQRQRTIYRKAAYMALARAILSDETAEMPSQLTFERHRAALGTAQVAA